MAHLPPVPVAAAPPQAVTKTPAGRWFSPNVAAVQHRPPSLRVYAGDHASDR